MIVSAERVVTWTQDGCEWQRVLVRIVQNDSYTSRNYLLARRQPVDISKLAQRWP